MINLFKVNSHYLKNKDAYLDAIDRVLSSGNYILGKNVNKLESKLKKFIGCKYAIATSNGTDALEICLRALNLKKNAEVIVPSFTWISSASVIKLIGARPVFCDIELDTFGLDYNSLKRMINNKTKAVIVVSLYGQICRDIFKIKKLCKSKKITLIEDAAQSFGAKIRKNNSCNIADLSTTSFFPTKSLGGYGDAGAVFTNNKSLATKIRYLKQHGSLDKKKFLYLGRNARLDELQAILILERLKDFNHILKIKRKTASEFKYYLKKNISFYNNKNNYPSYSLFSFRLKNRDKFINFLNSKKIQTGVYYNQPLHKIKFLNKKKYNLSNTTIASKEIISIPIHENLSEVEKRKIKKTVLQYFKNN